MRVILLGAKPDKIKATRSPATRGVSRNALYKCMILINDTLWNHDNSEEDSKNLAKTFIHTFALCGLWVVRIDPVQVIDWKDSSPK